MSPRLAAFARSGLWSLLAQAVQVVGGLALSVVVVRALTPSEFGILSIVRLATNFVAILSGLALERTVLRFLPELISQGRFRAAESLARRGFAIRGLCWLVVMAIGWAVAGPLTAQFGQDFRTELRIGLLTALGFASYNYFRAIAAARFATRSIAISTLLNVLVAIAATLAFLRAGWGVTGVLLGAGAGILVGVLQLAGVSLWNFGAAGPDDAEPDRVWRARVARYTWAFFGIAVLNHIVHSQVEIYFLGHFHGAEAAGFFQLGFVFAQRIIDFLPLALWEVSMAGFSHVVVREPERLPQALHEYLTLLYMVLTPVAFLGFVFSGNAIEWLYGSQMSAAIPVSRAYFALAFIAAFNAPVGMIIYARERTAAALKSYALFAVVNLSLDYVFIQHWSVTGAILGLSVAKLLNVLLFARIAWAEVPHLRVPWRFLVRINLASLPLLIWLPFEHRFDSIAWILLAALIALALLCVSYRVMGVVGSDEVALVRRTRLPLGEFMLRLVAPASERVKEAG